MDRNNKATRTCLLLALLLIPLSGAAQEKDKKGTPDTAKKSAREAELQSKLKSPRQTMQTLLRAVNENRLADAANCLTLEGGFVSEDARKNAGGRLAFKLKETMDRMLRVELADIPADPQWSESYRIVEQARGLGDEDLSDIGQIIIERGTDGLWRFAASTVSEIDDLYERWKDREKVKLTTISAAKKPFSVQLEELFPASLRRTHFLFADYQWICMIALVLIGFAADFVTRFVLNLATSAWFRLRRGENVDERKGLWKPLGLLAQAFVWYGGTLLIGLPTWALGVLLVVLKLFAVVAAIWTTFRFIDMFALAMKRRAEGTATKFDDLLVPLITKSLKILTVCVGIVICAEAFDWKITGLLAGVGIGGMALALASKDAVANLFGSATVLLDRPFEVGDWIRTSDVEGTVETVGFRSTRVRTFYNSLVTVPNSNLTTAVVDNLGKRTFRRIKTTLGLQYDTTPEQIDAFCEGVRELLRRHPYSRKDYYHVYLNQFSSSSLDVLLYCFLECPDWSVELRERHRLFVDILKLAETLGVAFAFPTQTLHVFQEESPESADALDDPSEAGRRAAANIAGPLLEGDQRPGNVEFIGPLDVSDEGDG